MANNTGKRSKQQPDNRKELEVIYEYVPTEDAEERILRVYEILLFEINEEKVKKR